MWYLTLEDFIPNLENKVLFYLKEDKHEEGGFLRVEEVAGRLTVSSE